MKRRMTAVSAPAIIRGLITVVVAGAVFGVTPGAIHGPRLYDDALENKSYPTPNPGLSPEEVVRIQLDALKTNDEDNRGIEVTFRFASPANRESTGPLKRFVRLMGKGGQIVLYAFYLSMQSEHPMKIAG